MKQAVVMQSSVVLWQLPRMVSSEGFHKHFVWAKWAGAELSWICSDFDWHRAKFSWAVSTSMWLFAAPNGLEMTSQRISSSWHRAKFSPVFPTSRRLQSKRSWVFLTSMWLQSDFESRFLDRYQPSSELEPNSLELSRARSDCEPSSSSLLLPWGDFKPRFLNCFGIDVTPSQVLSSVLELDMTSNRICPTNFNLEMFSSRGFSSFHDLDAKSSEVFFSFLDLEVTSNRICFSHAIEFSLTKWFRSELEPNFIEPSGSEARSVEFSQILESRMSTVKWRRATFSSVFWTSKRLRAKRSRAKTSLNHLPLALPYIYISIYRDF